jgi:hypothetical protein
MHRPTDLNHDSADQDLLDEFRDLWAEADQIWNREQDSPAFAGYVSADYLAVYHALIEFRDQQQSIRPGVTTKLLEWGSGLGVVTIMASRLGFAAFGIESESGLVRHAQTLAGRYAIDAKFSIGSFIPDEFNWTPESAQGIAGSTSTPLAAYPQLEFKLSEFELVYAYPWPAERKRFQKIVEQLGRPQACLMLFDAKSGIDLIRFGVV